MSHMHRWIATLMDNLDTQVDEQTRASVLENCGRACISRSFVEKALACRRRTEDLDGFLNELGKVWSHLHRDGDHVFVIYEACYCPLVKGYPGKLSPSFCNCSRGWIKELFETALERPVAVELEHSIKQGDPVCRFLVCLWGSTGVHRCVKTARDVSQEEVNWYVTAVDHLIEAYLQSASCTPSVAALAAHCGYNFSSRL